MAPLCVTREFDEDHWDQCVSDVVVAAADLMHLGAINDLCLDDLRSAVANFHECHVLALLSQLESAFREHGWTPRHIREQTLMWHANKAVR